MHIPDIKVMKGIVDILNDAFPPTLIVSYKYFQGKVISMIHDQPDKHFSAFYDRTTDSWTVWCDNYPLSMNPNFIEIKEEILTYLKQEGIACRFDYSISQTISVRAKMTKDVYIMPKPISDGAKIIEVSG